MDILHSKYTTLCNQRSDINEHLPTLCKYASECDSVFETGVRGVISSYALTYGLLTNPNNQNKKEILLNDLTECSIAEFMRCMQKLPIDINYIWKSNLEIDLVQTYDLTFIDTFHVYGQLKRELEKFSKFTNKYIIMHDTTIDGILGEAKRGGGYGNYYYSNNKMDELSNITNLPVNEILNGLWPAIEEFLATNPDWSLKERFTNNNGLTILEKTTR